MKNRATFGGTKYRTVINHLVLIAGALFLTLPIWAILMSSTHPSLTLATKGLQFLPGSGISQNYATVFSLEAGINDRITAMSMLLNSTIVALGVATLTTVLSLLSAYAVVFFRFRIAGMVFWLIFVTLLFPLESRMISTFGVTAQLGLINTHLGMILPVLAAALGTFFFRQYFLSLPEELTEAAILDGAGPLRFFIDFIVPLSWPRAGAIFVVSFMVGWHQYLWPLMISTDENLYTLVRGIRLIGQVSGPGMALITLSLLPPLIMVMIFQRWFFSALVESKSQ